MLFLPLLYFSPGWSFRFNFRIYYTFFWLNYWSHIRSDPLQQGLLGLGSAHLGHLPVERLAATLRHLTVLLRSCRSCCWRCAQVQLVRMSVFERLKIPCIQCEGAVAGYLGAGAEEGRLHALRFHFHLQYVHPHKPCSQFIPRLMNDSNIICFSSSVNKIDVIDICYLSYCFLISIMI